jgi:hypothetical protein
MDSSSSLTDDLTALECVSVVEGHFRKCLVLSVKENLSFLNIGKNIIESYTEFWEAIIRMRNHTHEHMALISALEVSRQSYACAHVAHVCTRSVKAIIRMSTWRSYLRSKCQPLSSLRTAFCPVVSTKAKISPQ